MNIQYEKSILKYASSFRDAVESVAKEKIFLASIEGFSKKSALDFIKQIEKNNLAQYFALDKNQVVGWCDILPKKFTGLDHVGILGMGVLSNYRSHGIGKNLLKLALYHAKEINKLEKVELEVFKSNTIAIQFYLKQGFLIEGEKIDSRKLDGIYDNIILMGKKL